jgi:hypothetical protein
LAISARVAVDVRSYSVLQSKALFSKRATNWSTVVIGP